MGLGLELQNHAVSCSRFLSHGKTKPASVPSRPKIRVEQKTLARLKEVIYHGKEEDHYCKETNKEKNSEKEKDHQKNPETSR